MLYIYFYFLFRKNEVMDVCHVEGGEWIEHWKREYLFRRPAFCGVLLFACRLTPYTP